MQIPKAASKEVRQFLKANLLSDARVTIRGSGHLAITRPGTQMVIVAATPSDSRSLANMRSDLRKNNLLNASGDGAEAVHEPATIAFKRAISNLDHTTTFNVNDLFALLGVREGSLPGYTRTNCTQFLRHRDGKLVERTKRGQYRRLPEASAPDTKPVATPAKISVPDTKPASVSNTKPVVTHSNDSVAVLRKAADTWVGRQSQPLSTEWFGALTALYAAIDDLDAVHVKQEA